MTPKQIKKIVQLLVEQGISLDPGLSDDGVSQAEKVFALRFPPDLRQLLQTALPVSDGFSHWRYGLNSERGKVSLWCQLHWPKEGLLYDVKNNAFWLDEWGERPPEFIQQKAVASAAFAHYPKLIPIYGHRYIPSLPQEPGNPEFSVYQMDII